MECQTQRPRYVCIYVCANFIYKIEYNLWDLYGCHKNGVEISSNNSRLMFGYPSLIINNAMPSDSGVYSLIATNHLLDNPSEVLGTDTGEFNLDVLCK